MAHAGKVQPRGALGHVGQQDEIPVHRLASTCGRWRHVPERSQRLDRCPRELARGLNECGPSSLLSIVPTRQDRKELRAEEAQDSDDDWNGDAWVPVHLGLPEIRVW